MHRLRIAIVTVLLSVGLIGVAPSPASAEPMATATSVALSSYSDCTSPLGLDIGLTSGDVTTETGLVTSLDAELLSFSQASGLSNFDGVVTGYNYSSPAFAVDPGTLLGVHATVGSVPPTAEDTAEWFVAFVCGATPEENVVVLSCFGPFGTCPSTANEAITPVLGSLPAEVGAGTDLPVAAVGCWTSTGYVELLDGGGGTLAVLTGLAVEGDGAFGGTLPVPADASGTVDVVAGCGTPAAPTSAGVATATLAVGVDVPPPPPPTTPPTTAPTPPVGPATPPAGTGSGGAAAAPAGPARPVQAQPTFTG